MTKKEKKKGVYVDMERYPELYEELAKIAEKNFTTPPPIIRKFIEDGIKNLKRASDKNQMRRSTDRLLDL